MKTRVILLLLFVVLVSGCVTTGSENKSESEKLSFYLPEKATYSSEYDQETYTDYVEVDYGYGGVILLLIPDIFTNSQEEIVDLLFEEARLSMIEEFQNDDDTDADSISMGEQYIEPVKLWDTDSDIKSVDLTYRESGLEFLVKLSIGAKSVDGNLLVTAAVYIENELDEIAQIMNSVSIK